MIDCEIHPVVNSANVTIVGLLVTKGNISNTRHNLTEGLCWPVGGCLCAEVLGALLGLYFHLLHDSVRPIEIKLQSSCLLLNAEDIIVCVNFE